MNADTKEFCEEYGPFKAMRSASFTDYKVRSRLGEDVAYCEDEDAATAIADALNDVVESQR